MGLLQQQNERFDRKVEPLILLCVRIPAMLAILHIIWLIFEKMDDLTRFKVLIYQFLSYEEERQIEAVSSAKELMLLYSFDSYYILKYYEAVRRYQDFKEFSRKLYMLLKWFPPTIQNINFV